MAIPIWTTKNGRKIPINEMTTGHLANTIAWLARKITDHADAFPEPPPVFQGEMAQYYVEGEWTGELTVWHEANDSLLSWLAILCKERDRRAVADPQNGATFVNADNSGGEVMTFQAFHGPAVVRRGAAIRGT